MRTQNEYHEERDHDLWHTYQQVCNSEQPATDLEAVRRSVQKEAPRFYVSEERATRVMGWMMKGDSRVARMLPKHRAMFEEIYRRTMALRSQLPGRPLSEIVSRVVRRPAPEFYLTPMSGYMILRQIRRRRYRERMAQLKVFVKKQPENLQD